jgi:hypothetical protein
VYPCYTTGIPPVAETPERFAPVTLTWQKLHNEELIDMYSSPNIFWVIKSRRMKWVGHVARMGEKRGFDGET